jgi:hypothetical protein
MVGAGSNGKPKVLRYAVHSHILEVEQVPVDMLINIPVSDKKGKVLGRAILTREFWGGINGSAIKEAVVLTDIIVYDPADRGKGIGDELMGFITSSGMFDVIVTGISTEAGRALCLKHGFEYYKLDGEDILVFRKKGEKDNG